jgi:hypothetical protein
MKRMHPVVWLALVCLIGISYPVTAGVVPLSAAMNTLAGDTIKIALVPEQLEWDPGDTVRVSLMVTETGPAFNAYDAHLQYDPNVLSFLPAPTWRDQEGALMTGTCPQTFHLFSVAPDSTVVSVNHSLLCPGASVSGPGELYRFMFVAKNVNAVTYLRLLTVTPTLSRFFYDGGVVDPFAQEQGIVQVGGGATAVPGVPPDALNLTATPNPFNPKTVFSFELQDSREVRLAVYSLDGRLVRTLDEGLRGPGVHRVSWDGRDQAGLALAAGKYLAHLLAGDAVSRHSVVLVK